MKKHFFNIPKRKRPKNSFVIGKFDPNKKQTIPRGYDSRGYAAGLSDTNVVGFPVGEVTAPSDGGAVAMGEAIEDQSIDDTKDYLVRLDEPHEEFDEENPLYEYGALMAKLSSSVSTWIESWAKQNIPQDKIYLNEDECINGITPIDEHHISLIYGISETNPDSMNQIIEDNFSNQEILMGKIGIFNENEKYDVIYIEVIKTPLLLDLYQKFNSIPHTELFPVFKPHITIAYVNKNSMDSIIGNDQFEGMNDKIECIEFSTKFGEKYEYYIIKGSE